jgi:DNA primase catalytic core
MARIPEVEIERLKREVSLERLAEARGIALKRHGADLIGLCPWHSDKEPSLVITPAKNLWHCLGACQAGGSVIDWVMKAEGISFRHAVELLREDYPGAGQSLNGSGAAAVTRAGAGVVKNSTVRKLECPLNVEASDQELLKQVIDYYHETLKQSPEALDYLERRGLKNTEMIERFRLGYANRSLGYRLPAANRAAGAQIRTRLQKLGILRESGHEHFNGSIVIPVFDEQGAVSEVYGRKIGERLRQGTPLHLYLPGPHRGVWNIEALQASKEIILCEALIDALTFWCAGYRNVSASYGVEGFTADHLAAFKRYAIEWVLIAYDRDEAGEKAAAALAEKLIAEGIACFRIQFPKGMDANEYAMKVKPAEKSLGLLIRSAVWVGGKERRGDAEERRGEVAQAASLRTADSVTDGCGDTATAELSIAAGAEASRQSLEPDASEAEELFSLAASVVAADAKEAGETPELSRLAAGVEPLASPLPPAPRAEVPVELRGEDVIIQLGDRCYRVRGLAKNLSYDQMKVTLYATRGEGLHIDTLNLCSAGQRTNFSKQAATELGVKEEIIRRDLGRVLLGLEGLQDEQIKRAMEPKEKGVTLTDEETQAALELLRDPRLLERILADFERCGIVGEQTNKLMGYLAAVSRKTDDPLAIIIQSSSSAGKTSLMEAVLQFVPSEQRVKYSAMTGQSLFYMGDTDLKHKILAIVEEEGAQQAAYALKLLQSEGELTIASTGKDPNTGRLITHEYRVEGPVMIFVTTTAVEIDEEMLNRSIVLTVNEEREQTRAIHRVQRELQTLEGLWAKQERKQVLKLHQDAQRLLRPLPVTNPYARRLTFLDDKTRTRRDHSKYLSLINSIALLHQYQRRIKTDARNGTSLEYLEVTVDDIEVANRLANEVLGRSLDELAPQTRRLLMLIDKLVTESCERLKIDRDHYRFTRREVREYAGWSYTQTRVHLDRLIELEYVLTHRGARGQSFVYELLYDGRGRNGEPFVIGLIDVEALRREQAASKPEESIGTTDEAGSTIQSLRGPEGEFAGSLRVHNGPITGGSRGDGGSQKPNNDRLALHV